MFRLDEKVAVITGANGVICSTLAKDLVKQGAKVALLDLSENAVESVAAEINANGQSNAIAIGANVLDKASLEQAADKVLSAFGKVDILINGAGGNRPDAGTSPQLSFFDLDTTAVKEVCELNFLGSVLPSQVFGKIFAKQESGSVINFASMASFRPLTKTLTYSAAKAAIVNFTQWLAVHFSQEYSPNIRVNAIAPGFLLTNQNRFLLTEEDGSLTDRGRAIIQNTPMGRFGEPEEMSGTVIYLCSDAAKFITGTVITVDGGFNAFSGV